MVSNVTTIVKGDKVVRQKIWIWIDCKDYQEK